ncbi:MAG: hypothetical protein FJ100_12270 [Deltaproteobacteria bacterium]|nr:hypothetical protein [Deltaproteobacteria bacterium]
MTDPADRPTLERQIGAVLFGRVLVAALDSLRAFILARLLDKAGFGILSVGLTWYGLCTGLGTLALPDALMALLPRCLGGGRSLATRALVWLAAAAGLGGALVLAVSLSARGETAAVLRWAALAVALDLPGQVLQAVLLGSQRHRAAALSGLLLSGAANLALLVPAAFGLGAPWLMASFCGVAVVRLALLWRALRGLGADTPAAVADRLWPTAWPLWLTSAAGIANRSLSTAVASALLPAAAFADLAVGSQELPVVTMLPNAVAVAVLPHLARLAAGGSAHAALDLWHAGIRRLALVMLPLWVVATVEAGPVLELLYGGPAWRSAALPFAITALLLPLRVTTYGTMLLALDRPRHVLWSQVAGIAVNAALLGGLASLPDGEVQARVGLAAAAGTAGQAVAIAWMLWAIAAATHTSVGTVFPWRDLAVRGLAAVTVAVPALWLRLSVGETLVVPGQVGLALGLATRIALAAALWLAVLRIAGWVPAEDWQALGRWARLEPLWRRHDR